MKSTSAAPIKFLLFFTVFQLFFSQVSAQLPAQQLVKNTWSALVAKYGPMAKKGEIGSFDTDGKRTEWPIWVRDISDTLYLSKDWVDGVEYHYNQSYWASMRNLFRLATSYPKTRVTSFVDCPLTEEDKEPMSNALIKRYGSTKNVYAITNEGQNPVEYMIAFFIVKGGAAKFIGYFAHPYVE